ncbi:ABC transporter substrate-binding protein [Oceanobacillus jeddahense]|uniref:ABC transporter substrate-binding protein n=1 Tax=Oceanobacillus jeddahense TaxID=1462527 RepID=UPI000595B19E|nr:ABC transporter substrate-binding protein [Oceanobacillus jeddahense]
MKKLIPIMTICIFILWGCSNDSSSGQGEETEQSNTVEITFWHNLDGDNAVTLEGIIDTFNEENESIQVNASFQDNIQQQMRTIGETDEAPTVFQAGSNEFFSESNLIIPVQDMINQDDDFDIESMNEAVIENHRLDGTLNAMPFNVFVTLLYYNVDLFEEAGLDPDDPPQTFSEIQEAAEILTDEDSGTVGFSIPVNTSFIYNLFAVQDELVFNNENGRKGEAPTETNLNSNEGKEIYNWISDMYKSGNFGNYGRTWSNTQMAFSSGELAMYLDSSAVSGIWLEDLGFEFKTAPYPVPDGEEWAGVNQGGSQLWLSNQSSEEEQEAGWEFIKYMVSPEVQSEWAAETGYVPVTPEAAEIEPLSEVYSEYEQFENAYHALNNTKPSASTAGPSIEQLEISEIVAQSFERLLQGENPEEVLQQTEEEINRMLQE